MLGLSTGLMKLDVQARKSYELRLDEWVLYICNNNFYHQCYDERYV